MQKKKGNQICIACVTEIETKIGWKSYLRSEMNVNIGTGIRRCLWVQMFCDTIGSSGGKILWRKNVNHSIIHVLRDAILTFCFLQSVFECGLCNEFAIRKCRKWVTQTSNWIESVGGIVFHTPKGSSTCELRHRVAAPIKLSSSTTPKYAPAGSIFIARCGASQRWHYEKFRRQRQTMGTSKVSYW